MDEVLPSLLGITTRRDRSEAVAFARDIVESADSHSAA